MFKLSNKQYDVAKDLVTVVLPALATLYATIAGIWGLGFSVEVVGTAAAITTFLGVALKINSSSFKKENTMIHDSDLALLEQSQPGITLSDIKCGVVTPKNFDDKD